MDSISYGHAAKQAQRIKKFIENPDSVSGVLTQPSVIQAGETVNIPTGRTAILANTQIDGTLTVDGTVFIPSGATTTDIDTKLSTKVDKVTSTDNAVVRFNGTTGKLQNSRVIIDDSGNLIVPSTINANKIYVAPANNSLSENLLLVGISGISNGLVVSKDTVSNMTLSYSNQADVICFKIDSKGNMQTPCVYNNTTASAANIFMDSAGTFFRSTSSGRYKTDIETIDKTYVDTFFDNARPIYYKSLSDNDNPNWGYWGFIAEEIAEFDKRLVHWRFDTKDVEVEKERVLEDKTIEKYIEIEKVNDESKPMIAEGVMYERITVLLTAKVQEQQELINSLTARLDRLEGNL